jgi:anti-sigma factor RsiW
MKVTQDVIMDLLPVYLSGEASPDTQDLMEEFLRQNPELSSLVEAQKREYGRQHELLGPVAAPSADHELQTLARTRLLMQRQKWSLALALTLTAFPFSFVFSGSHVTFMIVRDQPLLAAASWCGAAILWIQYLITRRRLRVTGLVGSGPGMERP